MVFKNAKTYNAYGSDIHVMADTLQKVFEKKMIAEKLMEAPPQPEVCTHLSPPPRRGYDDKNIGTYDSFWLKKMWDFCIWAYSLSSFIHLFIYLIFPYTL